MKLLDVFNDKKALLQQLSAFYVNMESDDLNHEKGNDNDLNTTNCSEVTFHNFKNTFFKPISQFSICKFE